MARSFEQLRAENEAFNDPKTAHLRKKYSGYAVLNSEPPTDLAKQITDHLRAQSPPAFADDMRRQAVAGLKRRLSERRIPCRGSAPDG